MGGWVSGSRAGASSAFIMFSRFLCVYVFVFACMTTQRTRRRGKGAWGVADVEGGQEKKRKKTKGVGNRDTHTHGEEKRETKMNGGEGAHVVGGR